MSDCLITGVLPTGVEPDVKRANIVFVRPWIPETSLEGLNGVVPGARVGIIPGEDQLVTTNPRDLTWEEFTRIHIHVGNVEGVQKSTQRKKDETLQEVRLDLDFGDKIGKKLGLLWLRAGLLNVEQLIGRQILAVTNLTVESGTEIANWFDNGAAAVLTVNGITVLEPAKEVKIGYSLA